MTETSSPIDAPDTVGTSSQSGAASPVGRRGVIAATAAVALATHTAHAQVRQNAAAADATVETARGSVFEGAAGTMLRGSASKGVPGVMVSNGADVTLTDADGNWELPVSPGQSLFVIKPRGWALPVDAATQRPIFAYIHEPDGTPASLGFRFAGLPPTGKLPERIDFPLYRTSESDAFNALLFTDPQPESLAEIGYIRDDVVALVEAPGEANPAAFGITTGDVMFDDLSFYPRYNRIIGTIGLPWFNCPGNHDMNLEAPDNARSKDTFTRMYGARNHAFQVGGVTFFALDNVEYLGTDAAKPNGGGKFRGYFSDRQLTFVRNVLAHVPKENLVVFFFHIPLRTLAGTLPELATVNAKAFLEAISSHPNSVSFSGHTHTNEHWYFGSAEGFAGGTHHHQVLAAVSGSWWSGPFDERGIPIALQTDGAPNGFHILEISGARYMTTLVPARDPNRSQLRLVLDSQLHGGEAEVRRDYHPGALLSGPIAQAAAGSTRLVANFFTGGPRSKVEMAIGRTAFAPMQRVERTDPFVVEVYGRNAATRKPWVKPELSTHVWQASLPADLAPGTHRITVRATDEYGRTHAARMVLEVG